MPKYELDKAGYFIRFWQGDKRVQSIYYKGHNTDSVISEIAGITGLKIIFGKLSNCGASIEICFAINALKKKVIFSMTWKEVKDLNEIVISALILAVNDFLQEQEKEEKDEKCG